MDSSVRTSTGSPATTSRRVRIVETLARLRPKASAGAQSSVTGRWGGWLGSRLSRGVRREDRSQEPPVVLVVGELHPGAVRGANEESLAPHNCPSPIDLLIPGLQHLDRFLLARDQH